MLAPIQTVADLPAGWIDEQDGGRYRLKFEGGNRLFGYSTTALSTKPFLHIPRAEVWRGRRGESDSGPSPRAMQKTAYFARPCDIQGLLRLDRVLLQGSYTDPIYAEYRKNSFIVAINCTRSGGTCFCSSMGTGPEAESGFDLAITELLDEDGHRFLILTGSEIGNEILNALPVADAVARDLALADKLLCKAREQMGRDLDTRNLHESLQREYEHPHWEEVARRCLGCGNCTCVCPTCFCSTVEDYTSLDGGEAHRERRWDSCFTLGFSYLHGGTVRPSAKARYRHWLMHKLSTWHNQYGSSGCVGCGRCITWCPARIDITVEAAAILAHPKTAEVLDGDD